MPARFFLPAVTAALALAAVSGCSSQPSSTAQVRPAQMSARSDCDQLLSQVEIEMPSAVGLRVAAARSDIQEARELCNSGQPEEGAAMLRGVLESVHEGG
jgi:hypothetical protein